MDTTKLIQYLEEFQQAMKENHNTYMQALEHADRAYEQRCDEINRKYGVESPRLLDKAIGYDPVLLDNINVDIYEETFTPEEYEIAAGK